MLSVPGILPLKALPSLPVCNCAPLLLSFVRFPPLTLQPADLQSMNSTHHFQCQDTGHFLSLHSLISPRPSSPLAFSFISRWDHGHATATEPSLSEWIHRDLPPRRPVCNMITGGTASTAKARGEKTLHCYITCFSSFSFFSLSCLELIATQTYFFQRHLCVLVI